MGTLAARRFGMYSVMEKISRDMQLLRDEIQNLEEQVRIAEEALVIYPKLDGIAEALIQLEVLRRKSVLL